MKVYIVRIVEGTTDRKPGINYFLWLLPHSSSVLLLQLLHGLFVAQLSGARLKKRNASCKKFQMRLNWMPLCVGQ